jgi:hypothetical protein
MTTQALAFDPFTAHRQFARVPRHFGTATFQIGDTIISGAAEFLLPAAGHPIAAFHTETDLASHDFGRDLVIEGTVDHGSFRVECPHVYVRRPTPSCSNRGCSLVSPVNGPACIQYGAQRPVARATALLNNFDYTCGDAVSTDGGFTRIGTPLGLNAGDRHVTVRHRPDRAQLLPLVQAGILRSASLVEMAFETGPNESDDALLDFSVDVAALCTFAAGAAVSVAMLSLLDAKGALVRRVVPQPVVSRFRENDIVQDFLLPRLFSEAFGKYIRMKQAHAPWLKLASYCGSLEDSPFLEQKFASLIMALEYFMRNSLIERGQSERAVTTLDFPALVGATRRHLGWEIPKHYMAKHTIRLLRNAVMHGGELPMKDSTEFRLLFDKWRLFLLRRVLIRLGYSGKVLSPHKGWASSSDVANFREEHNSFTPADANAPDPWMQLARELREHQKRVDDHAHAEP